MELCLVNKAMRKVNLLELSENGVADELDCMFSHLGIFLGELSVKFKMSSLREILPQ